MINFVKRPLHEDSWSFVEVEIARLCGKPEKLAVEQPCEFPLPLAGEGASVLP